MNYWLLLCNPDKWFGEKSVKNAKVNQKLFDLDEQTWLVSSQNFKGLKIGDLGVIKVGEDNRSQERRTYANTVVDKLKAGIYAIFRVVPYDGKDLAIYKNSDEERIKIKILCNLFKQDIIVEKSDAKRALFKNYVSQASKSLLKEEFMNVSDRVLRNFRRKEYRKYLKNKKFAENTIQGYSACLDGSVPKKLFELGHLEKEETLYIKDLQEIKKLHTLLDKNEALKAWNKPDTVRMEASTALKLYIECFKEYDLEKNLWQFSQKSEFECDNVKNPLNQILYGPPGTGKTFSTVNKAIEIIENRKLTEQECNDRKDLRKRFKKYTQSGQIKFVTFHQSYGYEEFVEGLKPVLTNNDSNEENKDVAYTIEDGVFKSICQEAEKKEYKLDSNVEFSTNARLWKVSLNGSGDNEIKTECYKEGFIRFSYEGQFKQSLEDESKKLNTPLKALLEKMRVGDIVVSLQTHKSISQIGIITSDYQYLDQKEGYRHARKVRWLLPEKKEIDFFEINKKTVFANSAIHRIYPKREEFFKLIPQTKIEKEDSNQEKNYVLVIDEINRGNISKIFGELITLIELSKRVGNEEEVRVQLPYSKDTFGVPKNVYILGTMNTADRSIALMDTALRRRFHFEEMMPQVEKLREELQEKKVDIEGIDLPKILEIINDRIEYLYDRDHMIGHAYFLELKESSTLEDLNNIFRNKIIPLLQEYFYDDWEKIQMVLGDHPEQLKGKYENGSNKEIQFIIDEAVNEKNVLGFERDDSEDKSKNYAVNKEFIADSYIKIYKEVKSKASSIKQEVPKEENENVEAME